METRLREVNELSGSKLAFSPLVTDFSDLPETFRIST